MLGGDVSNQLLNDDGLSGAGPTEHRRLATLEEGADEVDHLHPGLEDLGLSSLFRERRRIAMDRIAPHALHRPFAVDRLAHHVEEPSERLLADRDRDRSAYRDRFHSPAETIRRGHRDRAHPVVAEVLLNLGDDFTAAVALHHERVVDLGQVTLFELNVEDRADDLHDLALVLRPLLGDFLRRNRHVPTPCRGPQPPMRSRASLS